MYSNAYHYENVVYKYTLILFASMNILRFMYGITDKNTRLVGSPSITPPEQKMQYIYQLTYLLATNI